MTYEQVKDLIKTVDHSTLTEFELSLNNTIVKMSKGAVPQNKDIKGISLPRLPEFVHEIEEPITIVPIDKSPVLEGEIVYSPLVGTFYHSSAPQKPPFVQLGDIVKKGDILCIIEAMKIMNEIVSCCDGKIAEILVDNESMVEYNQPLFRIVKEV